MKPQDKPREAVETVREIIIERLADHGMWQREDGLRCEFKLLYRGRFKVTWALRWLRWTGVIKRRAGHWPGYLPYYRLTQPNRSPR